MKRWKHVACAVVSAAAIATAGDLSAQIQYATGQNVAPVYEGWMKNADGSIDMVFGYLNRNWEEVVRVPVGPDNNVTPGGPDRGQPTVFVPRRIAQPPGERRQQFVFRVRLPKDWRKDQEVVWTLTAHGRTDKAIGHLDPLLEMDNDVIAMNRGGGLGVEKNAPPSIKLTSSAQMAPVSGQVTLTALVSDDGLPKQRGGGGGAATVAQALGAPAAGAPASPATQAPASATRGTGPVPGAQNRIQGLHVRWQEYRGPAAVKFEPARSVVGSGSGAVKDGKTTATASFSEPGVYVLRAFADDTSLFATAEVTVTVSGTAPAGERGR